VRAFVLALVGLITLAPAGGCASRSSRTGLAANPFAIDAQAFAEREPKLAAKIGRSPFTYFRYRNRAFVDVVCAHYGKTIPSMPLVHLHGDAHLEQYAVAAEGRGLADFDASAIGPPIVDLARFATSLVLATPNDPHAQRAAIEALLRGYVNALDDPTAIGPEPTVATRIRSRFDPTTAAWLERVQHLISPLRPDEKTTYDALWKDISAQLRSGDPSLAPSFFSIKAGGRLDMGIGSGHAQKFLVRIEGPTSAVDDDLVMEAKAVESGVLGSCLRGVDLDATRVIEGEKQLSNAPQRFLAVAKVNGRPFYSHTWLVHYTELAVSDIENASELAELAEDVGMQLGRGHAKLQDESHEADLRRALKQAVETCRIDLVEIATQLAAEVTQAWDTYRASLPR
jgi:hypothetical protein